MSALEEVAKVSHMSVLELQVIIAAAGKDKERQRWVRLARLKLRGYSGRITINLDQGHITDIQLQTSDLALAKVLDLESVSVSV